jgi:hypothetical protein
MIDLIDNPGVHAWADVCRQTDPYRKATFQPVPYDGRPYVTDTITWQDLLDIYQGLRQTEFAIPLLAETPDRVTRDHLNIWHRCFTASGKIIENRQQQRELATEYAWLIELNEWVHAWEDRFYEWPKTELAGMSGVELNLVPDFVKQDIHKTAVYQDMTPYVEYHSWDHADVILDQLILGKTIMQSFLDNDDPRHWDTSGHTSTFGGCKLVYGDYRQQIYRSDIFQQWLDKNNISRDQCRSDFPIGRVSADCRDALKDIFSDRPMSASIEIIN